MKIENNETQELDPEFQLYLDRLDNAKEAIESISNSLSTTGKLVIGNNDSNKPLFQKMKSISSNVILSMVVGDDDTYEKNDLVIHCDSKLVLYYNVSTKSLFSFRDADGIITCVVSISTVPTFSAVYIAAENKIYILPTSLSGSDSVPDVVNDVLDLLDIPIGISNSDESNQITPESFKDPDENIIKMMDILTTIFTTYND